MLTATTANPPPPLLVMMMVMMIMRSITSPEFSLSDDFRGDDLKIVSPSNFRHEINKHGRHVKLDPEFTGRIIPGEGVMVVVEPE